MHNKIIATITEPVKSDVQELNRVLTTIIEKHTGITTDKSDSKRIDQQLALFYKECKFTSAIAGLVLEAMGIPYENVGYSDHYFTEFSLNGVAHIACMSYKQFLIDADMLTQYNSEFGTGLSGSKNLLFTNPSSTDDAAVVAKLLSYIKYLPPVLCAEKKVFLAQIHEYREHCKAIISKMRHNTYDTNPQTYGKRRTDIRYGKYPGLKEAFPDEVINLKKLIKKYQHKPLKESDLTKNDTNDEFYNIFFIKILPKLIQDLTGKKVHI
ncbi:MAG: hypothetical protein A2Y40_05705 [Candidatus Margulisbacteria bacterium GWF2_35_9]|nr:MAG: hypothetical protein A2Y40_05705 [Candidatus Margulisbacteria bacterium GWF2_35_9]